MLARTCGSTHSLVAAAGTAGVAGRAGQRAAAIVRLRARRRSQLAGERRIDDDVQVLAAHRQRMVRSAGDRVAARLLRELGGCAVGGSTGRSHAGRALAAENRSGELRLRRAPDAFDRRRAHVVAAVFAPPRRHAERAWVRVAVRRARRGARAGLAGRARDETGGDARRGRRRRHVTAGRGVRSRGQAALPKTRSICASANAARPPRRRPRTASSSPIATAARRRSATSASRDWLAASGPSRPRCTTTSGRSTAAR